jgi:hypothetical protein
VSGDPQTPQNCRRPKLLDSKVRTESAPFTKAKSPDGTVVKAMAGAPDTRWQVRQWHQPVSKGSLARR